MLASCGNDHLVKLWSIPDGKARPRAGGTRLPRLQRRLPSRRQAPALRGPQGRRQGVGCYGEPGARATERELDAKILYKYDPSFQADIGGVRSMAFSPDGSLLACAGITDVSNAFAGVGNPLIVLFD